MKLHEKIKLLIEERNWTIKDLQRKIEDRFDEDSIKYLTLLRTIHGETKVRESTLFQIALALGMWPKDIRKDTEDEEEFIYCRYNKLAYWEIEKNDLSFAQGRLILKPGARTESLKDDIEIAPFVKWLYGQQGSVTVTIINEDSVEEKHSIEKYQSFYFKSTTAHYFENTSDKKAVCLLIQNPKPKHLY